MTGQHYRDPHLDQLHNLHQGHMSVRDYIVIFKDLTHRSEVREHPSKTLTRFVWGLRPKIKRAMIIGPYDLDTVEEAFYVALRLDLAFKTLVNAKARCSKCEGYEHYDYQCPSESQHVRIVSSDEVDVSKVIEEVHVPSNIVSIIEDTAVDADTLVIDEIHMSDSVSDDVNEIVEHTILHLPVAYIDDITRPIAICNDTHKFVAYPYSTLQEFTVDNKVMVTSRCEAVRKLHAWRKNFDRALKRIAFIACELDNPWDPGINSVFSRDDAHWSTLYVLIELPSFTADPSRRPAPSPPPWYQHGVLVMLLRLPPWPD